MVNLKQMLPELSGYKADYIMQVLASSLTLDQIRQLAEQHSASAVEQSLSNIKADALTELLELAENYDPYYIAIGQLKSGTPYQNGSVSIVFIEAYIKDLTNLKGLANVALQCKEIH